METLWYLITFQSFCNDIMYLGKQYFYSLLSGRKIHSVYILIVYPLLSYVTGKCVRYPFVGKEMCVQITFRYTHLVDDNQELIMIITPF